MLAAFWSGLGGEPQSPIQERREADPRATNMLWGGLDEPDLSYTADAPTDAGADAGGGPGQWPGRSAGRVGAESLPG